MPQSIVKYSGPVTVDFASLTGKGVKIGIIDSGICTKRFTYSAAAIVREKKVSIASLKDIEDTIGHGTACAGIIKKITPDAELFIAKVFHDDLAATIGTLTAAIEWLVEQQVHVINLSLGTTRKGKQLEPLYEVCQEAEKKGIIVVSANCNEPKKIAYPAAFPNVIGVGAAILGKSRDFYYNPEDVPIEVLAKGDREIVQWATPQKIFMGGASFASPKVAAIAACIIEIFPGITQDELRSILQKNSIAQEPEAYYDDSLKSTGKYNVEIMEESDEPLITGKMFVEKMKKAVIYPFNKEMHSIIRFRHTLSYEVNGVVDFIGKRTIGKDPAAVLGGNVASTELEISADLEKELENADTLILGYVDELERITKKKIFEKCIRTAVEMKKNVFSLVPLNHSEHKEIIELLEKQGDTWFYSPVVDEEFYKKLVTSHRPEEHSEKPIVAVFGTSSQQGKFTCQLALKEQFIKMGYKVGHLSTEHQGELLGADMVFPSGYSTQTNLMLPLEVHIPFVRSAIKKIESQGSDLIISGGQSGIIPYGYGGDFNPLGTLPTIAMLMGLHPDAVILAINSIDADEFIMQSIQSIEAIGKCKVIGIVFSDKKKIIKNVLGTEQISTEQETEDDKLKIVTRINNRFGLPAVMLTDNGEIGRVAEVIESYLEKNE